MSFKEFHRTAFLSSMWAISFGTLRNVSNLIDRSSLHLVIISVLGFCFSAFSIFPGTKISPKVMRYQLLSTPSSQISSCCVETPPTEENPTSASTREDRKNLFSSRIFTRFFSQNFRAASRRCWFVLISFYRFVTNSAKNNSLNKRGVSKIVQKCTIQQTCV